MVPIVHIASLEHAGWSVWVDQIEGEPHRTVSAWRHQPAYQVHTTKMASPTPAMVRAWVESLPVESAEALAARDAVEGRR